VENVDLQPFMRVFGGEIFLHCAQLCEADACGHRSALVSNVIPERARIWCSPASTGTPDEFIGPSARDRLGPKDDKIWVAGAARREGLSPTRYSIRSASFGLMEAARRAGIQAATRATRTSTAGTSANVMASCGWIP
jgi:hypothetical protein